MRFAKRREGWVQAVVIVVLAVAAVAAVGYWWFSHHGKDGPSEISVEVEQLMPQEVEIVYNFENDGFEVVLTYPASDGNTKEKTIHEDDEDSFKKEISDSLQTIAAEFEKNKVEVKAVRIKNTEDLGSHLSWLKEELDKKDVFRGQIRIDERGSTDGEK